MSEDDIKLLFDRIAGHFKDADEGSHAMFAMLVETALGYRDTLMHSSGEPLTVGDVREALDAFMEVLRTYEIPAGLEKRVHDLVVLWLEQLRERIHH